MCRCADMQRSGCAVFDAQIAIFHPHICTSKICTLKTSAHFKFAHQRHINHMNITTIIGYLAAFGTTISFLPQAIKTIQTKNTTGISLPMYILFTLGTLFWLIYGISIGSYQVAIANAVTFVFASIILLYKVRYR